MANVDLKDVAKVNILGEMFDVTTVDLIDDDSSLLGQINHIKNQILLRNGLSAEKRRIVLLHEIYHAVFQKLGFEKETNNEQLIDVIASSIIQLLRENPEMARELVSYD